MKKASEKQPKDERNEVTSWGLLNAQVCSLGDWDEALAFIQREMPAGTKNNWQKDERPEVAPVACSNGGGRTHYLFEC